MKITMHEKYAYRRDPRVQVRVLCVDRPGCLSHPVLIVDERGNLTFHNPEGESSHGHEKDLVPLDETLGVTPGVYETSNGERVHIVYVRKDRTRYPVVGFAYPDGSPESWSTDGKFSSMSATPHPTDLVRRIGDLP